MPEEELKVAPKVVTGQPDLDRELAMAERMNAADTTQRLADRVGGAKRPDGFGNEEYEAFVEEDESEKALIGKIFAEQYEILHVLGRGGMSVVYRAKDQYLKQEVAIKTLHKTLTYDQGSLRRFQQEAATALSLDHQNVVRVRNFGISQGLPYMAMDLLNGVSFSDLIKRHEPLPVPDVLHIFTQTCAGLAHAHGKGIVHRDIKPSNIMLTEYDGDRYFVKILDFGIAKVMPSQSGETISRLTQTGEIFGSPLYMCPEQWSGKNVDHRSDVYSLGCVLYEALQGRAPFFDNNVFETMHQHLSEMPPPLNIAKMDPVLQDRLEAVIFRAMEKNPDKRYQSMLDFKKDLDGIEKDLAAGKLGRSLTSEFSRTERQLKRAAGKFKQAAGKLVVLAALLAIGGSALAWNYLDIGWFTQESPPAMVDLSWPMPPAVVFIRNQMAKATKNPELQESLRQDIEDVKVTRELTQLQSGCASEAYAQGTKQWEKLALLAGAWTEFIEARKSTWEAYEKVDHNESPNVANAQIAYAEALIAEGSAGSLEQAKHVLSTLLTYADRCAYFKTDYTRLLLGYLYYSSAADFEMKVQRLRLTEKAKEGAPKTTSANAAAPGTAGTEDTRMQTLSFNAASEDDCSDQALAQFQFLGGPTVRAAKYEVSELVATNVGKKIVDRKKKELPHGSAYVKVRSADLLRWKLVNENFYKPKNSTSIAAVRTLYEQALQEFKQEGDKPDAIKTTYCLAVLASQAGESRQAANYYAGCVNDLRELLKDHPGDLAAVLNDYARTLWKTGDWANAKKLREEAVRESGKFDIRD